MPHGGGYCQVPWVAHATGMAELVRSQTAASVNLPMPLGVVGWAGPEGLPMPIDPSIGEVRQLRRVACDNCRTRKLRCGRALGGSTPAHEPCTNCVERNLICTEFNHKRSRIRGRRSSSRPLSAPVPASYGDVPPRMYAPSPTGYAHPGYGCDERPLSYPQGAWAMPPAQGVPLETHAHLAQAMQPCDPLQQHLPSHARQCAGGSVLHPSLHGLPVMPSQSGAIPLQAPFMPPHGRGFLDQPVLPLHSGAIPPQMQAMLPQPPVTPLHLGMVGQKPSPCQSAAPTHMAPRH